VAPVIEIRAGNQSCRPSTDSKEIPTCQLLGLCEYQLIAVARRILPAENPNQSVLITRTSLACASTGITGGPPYFLNGKRRMMACISLMWLKCG